MPEFLDLPPSQLLLDSKNPRLDRIEEHQVEALHRLWAKLPNKLLGLAKHILDNGLDPSARLLVVEADSAKSQYVVLEGNRRIAALRALENPDSVRDQLTASQRQKLGDVAKSYRNFSLNTISCAVFSSREEAERWIELRHTPDADGAGVLMWGAQEKARFKDRQGVPELAVQVVDLVRDYGNLPHATKQTLGGRYITTLRRLLNDPAVRKSLGIDRDAEGRLQLQYPVEQSLPAIRRVVTDFSTGEKDVKDVYYKADRETYLRSLGALPDPKSRLAKPVLASTAAMASAAAGTPATGTSGGPRVIGAPGPRKKMVPSGLKLRIPDRRLAAMFRELAELRTDEFPNAIAVLLRVFLELSIDNFILKHKLMPHATWERAGLENKLRTVETHMASQRLLTKQELQPVRRALQKGKHMLGGSLESLHAYVHNQHFSPNAEQLIAAWDDLQVLFVAMWR